MGCRGLKITKRSVGIPSASFDMKAVVRSSYDFAISVSQDLANNKSSTDKLAWSFYIFPDLACISYVLTLSDIKT